MSDDTLLPSEPSVESTGDTTSKTTNTPDFYWQDGVAGEGDVPEWYKADKYKSVADQAKAYTELEKRFGGFKGAPEAYELPEEIDGDASYVQMLNEIGTKSNMNQETFSELLELGESMLDSQMKLDEESEIKALGEGAEERLNGIDAYLRNNLGDKYEDLKDVVNSAKAVELVESLIKSTAPSKLPTESAPAADTPTQDDIERMMTKKGEDGQILYENSETYREKVYQAIARMQGVGYVKGQHVNY